MSLATRNLITATAAIVKMDADARETLLLTILESNPSAVITAMKANGVRFGDEDKTTYKVVLDGFTANKIGLIKAFREIQGAGLADAKYWTEGETINNCPSGVFKVGMSHDEAKNLATKINHAGANPHMHYDVMLSATGIKAKVMKDTDLYFYKNFVSWTVEKGPFAN
jgi:large subunit ribosomal protein L7/L12